MSRQDDINKLIRTHERSLNILEQQQAAMGLQTPPHILIEIEDTRAEIEKLRTELRQLEGGGRGKPVSYNSKNIRTLLLEGFSEAELRDFCHDEPMFRPVENELSSTSSKAEIVQRILSYAERKVLMEPLLNWAKEQGPAKYEEYQPYDSSGPKPPRAAVQPPRPVTADREIFVSYAWGGESEQIVNKLDQAFQDKGITIARDKRDAGYKASIKEFMQRIGRGKAVIVIIGEKYLKSENCMFELVQIAKHGQFSDRIFPIVLADAQIYKPVQRIKYVQHWEQQIKELDEAMKSVSSANLQGFREEIDLYTEIRNTIAELTNVIKDMNTLTPEMHTDSGFAELFKAIERKLAE